eukprot:502022_1
MYNLVIKSNLAYFTEDVRKIVHMQQNNQQTFQFRIFYNEDYEILKTMQMLIETNWQNGEQKALYALCKQIQNVNTHSDIIVNNSYFCESNLEWININKLLTIFPNTQSIVINQIY